MATEPKPKAARKKRAGRRRSRPHMNAAIKSDKCLEAGDRHAEENLGHYAVGWNLHRRSWSRQSRSFSTPQDRRLM